MESFSNPAYGTLPAFQRPASADMGAGGEGGGFIPPPPGASQGGEPGPYPTFQQSHPSPFNWPTPHSYQPHPQAPSSQSSYPPWGIYAQSHPSQQSQPQQLYQPQYSHQIPPPAPPTQNSPYLTHSSQRPQLYQSQYPQQSDSASAPWTYGGYPPSPDVPITAPATTSNFNHTPNTPNAHNAGGRYSPYGVHIPPLSAPAETAPWSQQFHSHQQHHPQHAPSQHSQQPQQRQNHPHSPHRRSHSPYPQHQQPQHQPHRPAPQHRYSNTSGHVPFADEPFQPQAPLPFRGSANAPPPKKSALKRTNSQSANSGSQHQHPPTPRMQRAFSNGSSYGNINGPFGGNGIHRSGWPLVPPTMANIAPQPYPAPVIPSMSPSNVPGYTLPDENNFDAKNPSPRPRDWRADYFPRGGFSSYLPRIGRSRSDVEEYIDTIKRSLHPLLLHSPETRTPPLTFDLRYKFPSDQTGTPQPRLLGRHTLAAVDFAQLATSPEAPMLRLYHPKLPWYIDVHQSRPTGVTVYDVLVQLNSQMQAPIHNRHYYNDCLDANDRTALGRTYKERVRGRQGEGKKGILQVDFLGEKFVMEGLVRGKTGMWEIKTRRMDVGDL
ncbi:hypothetical protein AN958_01724 [Leucoagaricus sp. SymC.cos]|nr:hypothetical protein AN958_01724 [Leucoagaricus sp. SymC.cos]